MRVATGVANWSHMRWNCGFSEISAAWAVARGPTATMLAAASAARTRRRMSSLLCLCRRDYHSGADARPDEGRAYRPSRFGHGQAHPRQGRLRAPSEQRRPAMCVAGPGRRAYRRPRGHTGGAHTEGERTQHGMRGDGVSVPGDHAVTDLRVIRVA